MFDVAKTVGHRTLSVTMRYAHFAPEAGRAGIDKLGKALQGGTSATAEAGEAGAGSVAENVAPFVARQSA